MALPKVFDYDAEHDKTIVTEGVTGFKLKWFGMDIEARVIHIVADEGVLSADGQSIETVTKAGQQITLKDQETIDFYTANNIYIDSLLTAAMEKWALDNGKTGVINA